MQYFHPVESCTTEIWNAVVWSPVEKTPLSLNEFHYVEFHDSRDDFASVSA